MTAQQRNQLIETILNGAQKMAEFKLQTADIYTLMPKSPLVSPKGKSFSFGGYVRISRVKGKTTSGIKITLCKTKKNKEVSFKIPINNKEEAGKAVDWLHKNKCLPHLNYMRQLHVPAQTIELLAS